MPSFHQPETTTGLNIDEITSTTLIEDEGDAERTGNSGVGKESLRLMWTETRAARCSHFYGYRMGVPYLSRHEKNVHNDGTADGTAQWYRVNTAMTAYTALRLGRRISIGHNSNVRNKSLNDFRHFPWAPGTSSKNSR